MFSLRRLSLLACAALSFASISFNAAAESPVAEKAAAAPSKNPIVLMQTNQGDITLELFADKAPASVANFLAYTNSGFYNGTIFHRVIPGFMIQGGGFNQDMVKKNTKAPIINESFNNQSNNQYTISMARTNNPDSATSQFFINTQNNASLNAVGDRAGYAVFGRVIKGQEVVDAIEKVKTANKGMYGDVPVQTVVIETVTALK